MNERNSREKKFTKKSRENQENCTNTCDVIEIINFHTAIFLFDLVFHLADLILALPLSLSLSPSHCECVIFSCIFRLLSSHSCLHTILLLWNFGFFFLFCFVYILFYLFDQRFNVHSAVNDLMDLYSIHSILLLVLL